MEDTARAQVFVAKGKTGARGRIQPEPSVSFARTPHKAGAEPDWLDPSLFDDRQKDKIQRMRDNGIANPVYVLQVCAMFEVPIFMECAYLEHESGKGMNVFHNDDTWMIGRQLRLIDPLLEVPTEISYGVYITHRSRFGAQGVGPNGLTHPSFQARGDFYGGCWKPRSNMAGAVSHFAEQLAAGKTMDEIATAYNPGSPTYAETNLTLRRKWRDILND